MSKTNAGRFFEDYTVGQVIRHAVPRTVSGGERALYHALYPARHALYSSDVFAQSCWLASAPLDDLIAFHVVFGKTVPDVSLNAVANLGYAEGRWLAPVWPGDTLTSTSEVIGVKQNSNGKSGVVWVRTTGRNQQGVAVLEYVRWVMVRKGDVDAPAPETVVPDLAKVVPAGTLAVPEGLIGRIRAGPPARVRFGSLGGQIYAATVAEVGIASTASTTTFPVTVRLASDADEVRPGMAADVTLRLVGGTTSSGGVVVPAEAVGEDRAGRYVFVLAPQGDGEALALRRQVDLGGLTDDGITITSGVGDGDRVVTAGRSALADSQRVALLDAPASPPSRTD